MSVLTSLTIIPEPLQHALIPEAENVADSEDSEDEEWNYYRIDRDKEESRKQTEEESREDVQSSSVLESPDSARASVEVQHSDPDIDNRCKVLEEDISLPEFADLNVSIFIIVIFVIFISNRKTCNCNVKIRN